jgi:hypothetical protein
MSGGVSPLTLCAFTDMDRDSFTLHYLSITQFIIKLSKVGFCAVPFPLLDRKNAQHCFSISSMCTTVGMGG